MFQLADPPIDVRPKRLAATHERLLAGPPRAAGAESLVAHEARLDDVRRAAHHGSGLIHELERSGLLGRGGAGFPVGRKWRSVAERSGGRAIVVANGAEGEPQSAKDRVLMALRPHLVLDGAVLAAEAVGADEAIVYVGSEHGRALRALEAAKRERAASRPLPTISKEPRLQLVAAPVGYIAGESSAVVHYLNEGDARPTTTPPRPFEQGVGDRPTLVQNVESLAHAALIARFGSDWYRSAGLGHTRGTALVTVTGPVASPGAVEIDYGTTLEDVATVAGGLTADAQAVLLGGYFGGWARSDELWECPLDPVDLADRGVGFGCGLVALLPADACGVRATSRILDYMAGESARQCGPCMFGLGAIAQHARGLATGSGARGDVARLDRWADQVAGRGACHHPDGAAALLRSALSLFAREYELHERTGRCSATAGHGTARNDG